MKILFLKGLPGSGKSTYAREIVAKGDWKRVNKDDLRAMLDDGKWSKDNEKWVNLMQEIITRQSLTAGYSVIVDNTHLAPRHEEHYRQIAKEYNAKFEVKFFDTPIEECIKRDLQRSDSVGEKVIRQMYDQFLKPAPAIYKPPEGKPHAILCDIDGTLAHMTDRGPFDWAKVGSDTLDTTVNDILKLYHSQGCQVILLSGRDGSCHSQTIRWLSDNHVPYDGLLMRTANDMRKDAIVKREIFDTSIRDHFNVLFVLDDRDQVVEMWRNEIGLKVLQVAEGDF